MDDLSHWNVLLVDDEPDSLELVHDILTLHGARVHRAASGLEGRSLLASVNPTLVVLDLNMPPPDGWQLLNDIRAHPDLGNLPVVAITAYYSNAVAQSAYDAGFDAFFPKPIKSGEFLRNLRDLVG